MCAPFEASRRAGGGAKRREDGSGADVARNEEGASRHCLRDVVADVVDAEEPAHARLVLGRLLGRPGDPVHGLDGEHGVGAVRRLAGKHHGVGAVENRVRHVCRLGARGARVHDHGVEHLGGRDHGLVLLVALRDDPFLGQRNLLGWELDAQVAARHHDRVGDADDLVDVLQALLVLDLGHDVHGGALVHEELPDLQDVLRLPHEGGGHEVQALLHGNGRARRALRNRKLAQLLNWRLLRDDENRYRWVFAGC